MERVDYVPLPPFIMTVSEVIDAAKVGDKINVYGRVSSIDDAVRTSSTGKPLRDFVIIDEANLPLSITLWNQAACKPPMKKGDIVHVVNGDPSLYAGQLSINVYEAKNVSKNKMNAALS